MCGQCQSANVRNHCEGADHCTWVVCEEPQCKATSSLDDPKNPTFFGKKPREVKRLL
jgi:hypothetical protein